MDNNKQKTLLRLYYSALDESFSSFMKGDSPTAAKYFKKLREFTDISKEISIELSFKFAFGRNLYTHAAGSYGSARSNLYTGNFNEAKEHLLKTITILNKIGVLDQSLARLTFFAEELIPLELKYSEIFKANSLILLEGYLKSFLATLKNKEWARELLDSRKVCKEINISVSKNLHKKVFFKMNNLDFMFVIIARFKCASFLYDVINSKQVDFSMIDRLRGMLRNQGLTSHYREEIDAIEKFVTGFRWFSAYNDSDDLKRIMKKDKVELEIELLENLKLPHKQDDKTSLTISEIKNIKKFMQVISHVSDGTMQIDKSVRKGVGVESRGEKDELKKPEVERAEYARMWANQTEPEGKPINEQKFNDILKNKGSFKIFVIDRGDEKIGSVGEIYLNNEPVFPQPEKDKVVGSKKDKKKEIKKYLTPIEYSLLVHTLKNQGKAGDIFALIKECWRRPDFAKLLRGDWNEIEKGRGEVNKFRRDTSGHRKTIGALSSFLNKKIGIKLRTFGKAVYRFSMQVKFCLIEVS